MELVKNLTRKINFDIDVYNRQYLQDVLDNGRPRYTDKQKSEVLLNIEEITNPSERVFHNCKGRKEEQNASIYHEFLAICKRCRKDNLRRHTSQQYLNR